jgi:proteic killer suppression protein
MIRSFRHRGLKRLHERGERGAVGATFVDRIEDALGLLDIATSPRDLDLPGFRLHPLKGALKGYWSITVSGNWRLVFRFDGTDVVDVDFIDYH